MKIHIGWTARVFLAASLMVLAMMFVPLTTSLGQGIQEDVVTGWVGRYDHDTGAIYCRIELLGGGYHDIVITDMPRRDFAHRGSGEFWTTPDDMLAIIRRAYILHPRAVEQDLGTRDNVERPSTPFPGNPVAYSTPFLRSLARHHWNPMAFGGPDIPPGSVPWATLSHGNLPIDTLGDMNTLHQCDPGRVPPSLMAAIRRSALRNGPASR